MTIVGRALDRVIKKRVREKKSEKEREREKERKKKRNTDRNKEMREGEISGGGGSERLRVGYLSNSNKNNWPPDNC